MIDRADVKNYHQQGLVQCTGKSQPRRAEHGMVPVSNAASYLWASHLTEPKYQVQKRRKYKYKIKGLKVLN
jgi:hypothetical protein